MQETFLLHLTDVHVDPDNKQGLNNLYQFIEDCNNIIKPDAVVVTGDCTDNGTPEEFKLYNEIFSQLNCKLFSLPGNHDKPPYTEYSELVGPTKWIHTLNNCQLVGFPSPISQDEFPQILEWLTTNLGEPTITPTYKNDPPTKDTTKPILYFTHYPLAFTEGRYRFWGKGHTTKIAYRNHMRQNGEQAFALLKTMMEYPVIAAFNGHANSNHQEQCIYSGTKIYLTQDFTNSYRAVKISHNGIRVDQFQTNHFPAILLLNPEPYIPGSEHKVSGAIPITIQTFSKSPITTITWNISKKTQGTLTQTADNTWQGLWDTTKQPNGIYTLMINAVCANGEQTTKRYKLIISNKLS